jgi:hypothetical protein
VIPEYYSPQDRAQGYIETTDRLGEHRRVPIISLGAAVVTNENRRLDHPVQIAQICKNNATVIASSLNPTHQYDFLAEMRDREFSVVMSTFKFV